MNGDSEEVRHSGRARNGKGERAEPFDPAEPVIEAMAAGVAELDRPRPATTRFPIDVQTFLSLKGDAPGRSKGQRTLGSTVVKDRKQSRVKRAIGAAREELASVAPGEPPAAAPVPVGSTGGIGATGWLPWDCTLATGPQHVLVSVNASVHIYAKAGGPPVVQRTLAAWFQNVLTNAKIFDPKALFDQHAGRWVLAAVALPTDTAQKKSWFLVSVSRTSDPLGGWFNYALDATRDGTTATTNWADYPGLGVDNRAVYLSANMFRFGGTFQYAKIRVLPKTGLYSGGTVNWQDHVRLRNADGSMAFTVQPCHTFGAPGTQYFINSVYPSGTVPTPRTLSLWALSPAGTLTRRSVTTDPFGLPPDAGQKGGGTPLDTGDVRILNAVFRGGSVYTTLTTFQNWGDGVNVAAIHWFQVNATSGALVQQGIYGAAKLHYFYPAIMPDANGNVTVVFSRSGAAEFAGIHYTGRLATDPLGKLQPSALLKAGAANYKGLDGMGRNRWGDYAGISADVANGRLIWIYSGYAAALNTWGTWIGSSQF